MYIADLHIHSKYSRATSRDCDLMHLDLWARKKGVGLLGTGDFTHPAWREEMQTCLEEDGAGLYRLRKELRLPLSLPGEEEIRFVISGEISTIYKWDGKTRKVHHLILLPSLQAAQELSRRLEIIGNIHSDGRPILGLDSRDLIQIVFDACPEAIFIPAHIWTPHFSVFGAFSAFSSLEECYGPMAGHIHALETGLSSDPPMNRMLSSLDSYQLVSNSDAHSPARIAREANLLAGTPSYAGLRRALETGEGLMGTIEFFPEEGKYHLDGHRACKCRLTPEETAAAGGRCPICGKKITVGVLNRVSLLADRREQDAPTFKPFESLIPLPEVLADCMGLSVASKKVQQAYEQALTRLGPEMTILRQTPLTRIREALGPLAEEAVSRLRGGKRAAGSGLRRRIRPYFPVRSRRAGIPAGPAVLSGSGRSRRAPEKTPDRRPGTELGAGNRPARRKSRTTGSHCRRRPGHGGGGRPRHREDLHPGGARGPYDRYSGR